MVGNQIKLAISVDVHCEQGTATSRYIREGGAGLKGAISVAQTDARAVCSGGDIVELAIAVEIGDGNTVGNVVRGDRDRRLKSPISIAEGYPPQPSKVENAVAVKVPNSSPEVIGTRHYGRLEGAVAIAGKYGEDS